MWQIIDHTGGRIRSALEKEWGAAAAAEALERRHCFGAATEIAHELQWLGFQSPRDFDLHPAAPALAKHLAVAG